eukprot:scaffold141_cov123-Isochrysis_galbana.AAC.5
MHRRTFHAAMPPPRRTERPPGNSHVTRRCAMTCNTEGTAVSEVATVVRNLDGIAMSGEMGNAGAMRMST